MVALLEHVAAVSALKALHEQKPIRLAEANVAHGKAQAAAKWAVKSVQNETPAGIEVRVRRAGPPVVHSSNSCIQSPCICMPM